MIETHPAFLPPKNRAVGVWRYMSLTKLLWMLQRHALYFARSDCLGDPFEGYYTETVVRGADHIVAVMLQQTDTEDTPINRAKMHDVLKRMLRAALEMRQKLFVNCWHMNEAESAAMWKLYTKSDEAICVKSTFSRLANALPEESFCGAVNYIDFKSGFINPGNSLHFIMHKRLSFAHEREVRAVIWLTEDKEGIFKSLGENGLEVPVDLNIIEEVYISPSSSEVFKEIVEALLQKYNLAAPVRQSTVNAPPTY